MATPVCMPNRATLMTGRMPSVHGVRSNGSPLSLQSNTFVDALRAARLCDGAGRQEPSAEFLGYSGDAQAAAAAPGRPGARCKLRRGEEAAPSDGPYDQEHPKRWEAGRDFDMSCRSTASSTSTCAPRTATMVGGHYYVWLKSRRGDADALRDRKNQLPHDYVCPQAFRTPIPEELYPTSYIADKSCEWLDRYAAGERDQPFFLMASFPDPHHPFTPPGRYWSMYRPQDMALPPSFHHGNRPLARAAGLGAGAARERQRRSSPSRPPSRSTSAKRARRWR